MQSISLFVVLAFAFSCTLALDIGLNQQWKSWKDINNKRYSDAEEHVRRVIWESNLKKVEEHNLKADLGIHTYWLEMNKFADLTINEFVNVMNGYNATMRGEDSIRRHTFMFNRKFELPDTVDWRTKGCVTGVKDQGQCGSDWAFTAVAAVESVYCVAMGKLVPLSEQQLVDCSTMGCTGGTVNQAFKEIAKMGGLESEASYPYGPPGACRFDPTKIVAKVTGFVDLPSGVENALEQAVATIGPIPVAIDASHSSFQFYKRGVYNEPLCSQIRLDHSVIVVGYGIESGKDYWLVKNSWGTSWGDQGYIKMTRNKNNQCGIATADSYPRVG